MPITFITHIILLCCRTKTVINWFIQNQFSQECKMRKEERGEECDTTTHLIKI